MIPMLANTLWIVGVQWIDRLMQGLLKGRPTAGKVLPAATRKKDRNALRRIAQV
jgi:hypothetical protein